MPKLVLTILGMIEMGFVHHDLCHFSTLLGFGFYTRDY